MKLRLKKYLKVVEKILNISNIDEIFSLDMKSFESEKNNNKKNEHRQRNEEHEIEAGEEAAKMIKAMIKMKMYFL